MRHLTCLVPLLLLSTACVTTDDAPAGDDPASEADGKADGPGTPRVLVASEDALEQGLAAVEGVAGLGLKAITVWARDTEVNGRDLWLTLQTGGTTLVWRTPEDVFSVHGMAFLPGLSRVKGTEHRYPADGGAAREFWLDVRLDQEGEVVGPTIHLKKDSLFGQREYTLDAVADERAAFMGQIDDLDKVESDAHLVRLFTLDPTAGAEAGAKELVLVLTDGEGHHVFPLGLTGTSAGELAFDDARAISFDVRATGPAGEQLETRYAVAWDAIERPSLRRLP